MLSWNRGTYFHDYIEKIRKQFQFLTMYKHILISKNFNNTRDFSSKSIKTLGMFYQRQTFVYKTSLLLKAQKSIIGNYPTFFFVSSSIKAKRSIAIIHKYFNSWILFFCWRNKKNAIFDYVHISCGQKIINVTTINL